MTNWQIMRSQVVSSMTLFAVRRYVRQSNRWDDISHYTEESWSFLGPANKFSTKAEAQKYLDLYKERINSRLNHYGKNMPLQRLKVFKVVVDPTSV